MSKGVKSFVVPMLCSLLTLIAAPAAAQNPTGAIAGRVVDSSQLPIPGVTVTITSPALQGSRSIKTTENGDFLLPLLPPGNYLVTVEQPGFSPAKRSATVAISETVRVDLTLQPAAVDEQVVVIGRSSEAFVGTVQGASSFQHDFVRELPTTGTLLSAVNLAAGVSLTGPGGNTSISGAMSFENLFLLNGVQITDNVRGTPFSLFIEDAIQETTITTSGISAEYGRFSGGVVNAITRSGGNEFSGSFRTTFTNDDWRTVTPFNEPKTDDTVATHEYTLGGRIIRDRLWFFGAGRNVEQTAAQQTGFTSQRYESGNRQKRFEGKLTYSLSDNHRVQGSYTGIRHDELGNAYPSRTLIMDLRSVVNRQLPQNLYSAHYTGVVGSALFLEGQFSRRDFAFKNSGATTTDLIDGTVMQDQLTEARWWSPTFCGICVPEERRNQSFIGKGTYLLSTPRGAHTMTFGYDYFNDIRKGENHQSGSDYHIWTTTSVIEDGIVYPVAVPDESTWIIWWPVLQASRGTNFRTHSLFFNDSWAYNRHLTVNLGLRYDKNDGVDAAGQSVARDSAFGPRLGLVWDPRGDGVWAVNASYSRYVAGLANAIADSSSPAGTPAIFAYYYLGPPINTAGQPRVSTPDAIRQMFDWFFANGGTDRRAWFVDLPGVAVQIRDSLRSPHADELAFGVSRRLPRGALRADAVWRQYGNFYGERVDMTTGTVFNDATPPEEFDLVLVENTNAVSRSYAALKLQASWRFTGRIRVGGSYTLSRLSGDINGENVSSGPLTANMLSYPEYFDVAWSNPKGRLLADQPHRLRAWANIDAWVSDRFGTVGASPSSSRRNPARHMARWPPSAPRSSSATSATSRRRAPSITTSRRGMPFARRRCTGPTSVSTTRAACPARREASSSRRRTCSTCSTASSCSTSPAAPSTRPS
jgi:hypothetical protein